MNHGGIQHFPKQSCKELLNPHCFVSWHRYCNILSLCGTQSHRSLLHATLGNHGRPQTKATPRGALPVHSAPCPIRIRISPQSHVNTRNISQAISNCASQVSQHMLRSYPMHMFRPGLPKRPPPLRSGPPKRAPSGSVPEPHSLPRSDPPEPRSHPLIHAPCRCPNLHAPARSRNAPAHAP
jgi:hypothetical protein